GILQLLEECIDGVADFALFSAFFGIADEQGIECHGSLLGSSRIFISQCVRLCRDGVHQPRRAAAIEVGALHRRRKSICQFAVLVRLLWHAKQSSSAYSGHFGLCTCRASRFMASRSCDACPMLHARAPKFASVGSFQCGGMMAVYESSSNTRSGCPAAIISWFTSFSAVPKWQSRPFSERRESQRRSSMPSFSDCSSVQLFVVCGSK